MTTLFRDTVYEVASAIPKGSVATYGQVAALAGRPGAARAVGMFMSKNKDSNKVPCHRVVASNGALTGYGMGNGLSTKKTMLQKEGVQFKGEKVDLSESQWQPKKGR